LFIEMKLATVLNEVHARDPDMMPAWRVLA
jgi:hypothetical protein